MRLFAAGLVVLLFLLNAFTGGGQAGFDSLARGVAAALGEHRGGCGAGALRGIRAPLAAADTADSARQSSASSKARHGAEKKKQADFHASSPAADCALGGAPACFAPVLEILPKRDFQMPHSRRPENGVRLII